MLESETSTLAVPIAGIKRLQGLDLPLRVHVASSAAQPPARATLGMAYPRKGLAWVPEYTLKILDETTAELTLRGTLVIRAQVPGKPLSASDGGVLKADPTKLQLLDRAGTIERRLQIASGATRTVTYKYER